MPQVGQDIPSAVILEWRKEEGQSVEKGEVLLVVESDKASFEVEAEAEGVLLKIVHGEGEEVDILQPVGYVGGEGEEFDESALHLQHPPEAPEEADRPAAARPASSSGPRPAAVRAGVIASPSARRIARERGIDLSSVTGSGPGGRIIKRDLAERPAVTEPGLAPGDSVLTFSRLRRRIAERLTEAQRSVPMFALHADADMTETAAWRRERNERTGVRVTITDLIVKACADALAQYPRMNAHVYADRMVLRAGVNVGVAVATEEGLLVPVIGDADGLSLEEIAAASRRNAEAANRGALVSDAVGTFTVSSLGMYGVARFDPIINPPECAILGVGAIEQRVVAVNDTMRLRRMMTLTLVGDHRAVDGSYAAKFLECIRTNLQNMPAVEETER